MERLHSDPEEERQESAGLHRRRTDRARPEEAQERGRPGRR